MSKMLVTIVTDVPLGIGIRDLKAREPDYDKLRQLFTELEFRTLLNRLPRTASAVEETRIKDPQRRLRNAAILRIQRFGAPGIAYQVGRPCRHPHTHHRWKTYGK